MDRELSGRRKDKDRARRARRLSGAVVTPRREPPKPPRPEAAPDDWQDDLQGPDED